MSKYLTVLLALGVFGLGSVAGRHSALAAPPGTPDPGHYIETRGGRTFTRDGRVFFIANDTREINSDSDPARAGKFLASGDYRPAMASDVEWMDARCQVWNRR